MRRREQSCWAAAEAGCARRVSSAAVALVCSWRLLHSDTARGRERFAVRGCCCCRCGVRDGPARVKQEQPRFDTNEVCRATLCLLLVCPSLLLPCRRCRCWIPRLRPLSFGLSRRDAVVDPAIVLAPRCVRPSLSFAVCLRRSRRRSTPIAVAPARVAVLADHRGRAMSRTTAVDRRRARGIEELTTVGDEARVEPASTSLSRALSRSSL